MSLRQGFSIIELLVIIVFLGILAAVAIPKFNAASIKYKSEQNAKTIPHPSPSTDSTYLTIDEINYLKKFIKEHNKTYEFTDFPAQ
jgi:hypothetical protein